MAKLMVYGYEKLIKQVNLLSILNNNAILIMDHIERIIQKQIFCYCATHKEKYK